MFDCRGLWTEQSVLYQFDHKGVLIAQATKDLKIDNDTALEHAIEIGAEDVIAHTQDDEKFYEFLCSPSQFFKVKLALEKIGYDIIQCDVEYLPKTSIVLDDADKQSVSILHSKLTSHPDIQNVYSNYEE